MLRADDCENATSFNKSDEELLKYVNGKSSSNSKMKAIKVGEEEADTTDAAAEDEEFTLEDDRFRQRLDRHGGGLYIGENTNVQDGCILTAQSDHCLTGNGVTIGHLAHSQCHCRKFLFDWHGIGR